MSFEYLCQHCGKGHVRPIQFSFDEAVVTCDNEDCESRLDVSPWSCVVNRNIRQVYIPASNPRLIQHWSRSSSSSSGIQSDVRSPGFSPARSYDSVTDREVENLLRRYINARPKIAEEMAQSCSKPNSEKVKADDLNSFSSFFELLDGLDLEGTDQTSGKECHIKATPAACDEVKFDPVSSELESWMKGFESPMSSIKKGPGEDFGAEPAESADIKDSISNRLYIPSRGSAFSQVSPKNDSVQSSSSCSLVDNDAGIVEKNQENTVAPIDKAFDVAKNCTPPFSEAQFLSPATSTVSEDSGYDESGSKINSVLFLPSLEKRNIQSCAIPDPDKNTTSKKNKFSKSSGSSEENSGSDPVLKSNSLSTTASSGPCTQLSQLESVVMNDVGSLDTSKEQSGSQCDQVEQDGKKQAVNSSGTLCESSQFSDSISSSETKSSVSSADTNNSNASTLQEPSINNNSSLQSKESELCVKPPTKKSGRPRGRPRKHQEVEVPKRENKRRRVTKRKEEISHSSASLSKGLASVLQTPSFHVRKEEVRHHNITTLNFRNRLNGTFIQDPWSVPELNLEELCIEIVVQGQREPPSSQKESRVNVASNEETKTTDPSKLDRDARREALCLENKETDNTVCVSNTSDVECLKSSTGNIGQSLEVLKSQVKVSCDVTVHESSDMESEESSSSDGLNETCTTKGGETDLTVNLLLPDSGSRTGTSNALENSSVQRLKQLHTNDEGLSSSEKNQEKTKQPFVSVEREKQTCKKFCGGPSYCRSADTRAKVKTEENTGDLSHEEERDCSKAPKMDTLVTRCCIKDDNLNCDESTTHIKNKSIDLLDLPQAVSPSLVDVKEVSRLSELSSLKVSELPVNSLLDTSFDSSLSILYETDSCMLDFASSPNIRSWMRYKESKPGVIKKEKIDTDVSETSLIYGAEKKIRGLSSDYFNTLLEDLDFEEEFFQCPTTENLSSTFGEHLSSSLFFGETACSSATSVEGAPVYVSSMSVCTSVLDLSSVSTTVTTVISPTSKPGLNFSSWSSKSTNGTVPLSGVSTTVSKGAIPSPISSATSVTHSLNRAITSIQDISSLPSPCDTSENKMFSDRVLDRDIKGKDVCNPYNKKLVSDTNLLAKNLQEEQESSKGLWSQNDCETAMTFKEEVHEPTSNEYSSLEKTGNSCKNKASTYAASMLETPFISIDSDDEIQIIMPKEKSLTDKRKSTITTVHSDVTAEGRLASQANCLSSVSCSLEHPSILPISVCSETSQKEVKDGRLKDLSISQEAQETDGRHQVHKPDTGKDSSSTQENNLMCGIMDNSVVHDPSCFSPNAKGFIEFKEDSLSERPPAKIKFYFGLKKTDFTLCKDLEVSYTSKSNISQELLDDITLKDKHLGSPDRTSMPFSFEVGSKFGCTKSSPQHKIMSPTSDDSNVGVMDADANNVSFLCYGSSSETCSSSDDDDDDGDDEMEYDSRDVGDSKVFSSLTKNFAPNVAKEVTTSNSTDLSKSVVYDESGGESESDREAIFRRRILLGKGVLRTDTSDSDSHVFKKPLPCFKRKLDSDWTSESESQSEFEEQSSLLMKSPFYVPVMPLKKEVRNLHKLPMEKYENLLSAPKIAKKASALHKPTVQSSEKLLLSPKFPLQNKFSSGKNSCAGNIPIHSTQKQIFILNKSTLSEDALRNAEPPQEKEPLCLLKGENNQRTPFQTYLLQSPNSSSPLSHQGNQKQLHHPFQKHTMPCSTSIEKPLLCDSISSSSSSSSSLPSTNTDPVASPLTSLKIHSVIDCQMPSVTNPSVIIPPVLRSSYAPVQECMQNVSKDVGSSNKVNNMQEKLIVLKNETPNGPVMKVLRVNVIPNNKVGSPLPTDVSGSGTRQLSVSQAPKPNVKGAKPVVTCAVTANPSVSLVSNDSLEGIRSNCSKRKDIPKDFSSDGTKKQLITKIKVGGANERYYVRPTFTMMKAISEMRKNKDQDTTNDDTEVDCVELPDGVPISHPLHIPNERSLKHWYKVHNSKMLARTKKRRKRKKKYILQKIQNLVKEKVQETVSRSKDEIPEMVAVFVGGKLHIYSRDTDIQSAQ